MKTKQSLALLLNKIEAIIQKPFSYNEENILLEYEKEAAFFSNKIIKILSIFGGFAAMAFLLLFLISIDILSSDLSYVITGSICIFFSYLIYKLATTVLWDTMTICMYLTGLLLIIYSIRDMSANTIGIICLLISILAIILMRSYVLIFLNIIIAHSSILYLLNDNIYLQFVYSIILTIVLVFFFRNEAKLLMIKGFFNTNYNILIGGLVFAYLSLFLLIYRNSFYNEGSSVFVYLSALTPSLYILYLPYSLFQKKAINIIFIKKIILYIALLIVLILCAAFPLINASILLILLSFSYNHKAILVFAIVTLIYAIIQYYYDLSITLLLKSILLMVSGIILLFIYFFSSQKMTLKNEKI